MRRTTVTVVTLVVGVTLTGCGSSKKTGTAAPAVSGSAAAASALQGSSAGPSAGASGAPGTGGGTTTGGPTSGSGGAAAGGGSGTPCIVGTWKTSGVNGALTGDGVNGTVKGGSGVTMTVAAGGATRVGFDGMTPIAFTYAVGGGSVQGTFAYGGTLNGAMKLPAGGVTSGTWSPSGTVDFTTLTATVDITNPAVGRVADKQPLADFVSSGTTAAGAAVDAQPLLKTGQFSCSGTTLTIAPPAGTGGVGTWTLTKA